MKTHLFIFLSSLLLNACQEQNHEVDNSEANQKLAREYYEQFNQHNWQAMAEMYSQQPEFKDPSLGTTTHTLTKLQIVEKYTELNSIFPNIHDSIVQIYTSGPNHIVVEFISTGTASDSSAFHLPICTIFKIENGKITKDYTYYDN